MKFVKKNNLILLVILTLISFLFPNINPNFEEKVGEVLSEINIDLTPKVTPVLQNGQVIKVVDGDTIDVFLNGKEQRVRIIGINTPETVDPRSEVECFGKEASEYAKKMLFGKIVTLEPDLSQDSIDRYGRILRYVYLPDKNDFGLKMIKEGYAYEYTYENPYQKQEEYKAAQLEAETNRRGLWSENACN